LFAIAFPLIQSYLIKNPFTVSREFYIQTLGYPFLFGAFVMIFSFDFYKKLRTQRTLGYFLSVGMLCAVISYGTHKPITEAWPNILGIALALVLIVSTIVHLFFCKEPINKKAALPHLCIGIILLGACGNALWMQDKLALITVGESITIQNQKITLTSITPKPHTNYLSYEAAFSFEGSSNILEPERRLYYTPKIEHSESALLWKGMAIYYIILGETSDQHNWMVRVYYTPLVFFVWMGGILLGLSIIWYALKNRRRAQ
jgi:cytochrome c biogenesis factor